MKIYLTFLFSFLFLISSAGYQERKELYSLNPQNAKEFISANPDAVSVFFNPQGGEEGKGVLVLEIKKKSGGLVEVKCPVLKYPSPIAGVSARQLEFAFQLRLVNTAGVPAQFRFRLSNGRYALAVKPENSRWDTFFAPQTNSQRWRNWNIGKGRISLAPRSGEGQPVILIDTARGGGRIEIEKMTISDICTLNHTFFSGQTDHIISAESGRMKISVYDPGNLVSGKIAVLDEEGKLKEHRTLKNGISEVTLQMPERGFYDFSVRAVYRDGKQINSSCSAAVIGVPLDENIRRLSRYGICSVYANSKWAKKYGFNALYHRWSLRNISQRKDGTLVWQGKPASFSQDQVTHAAMFDNLPKWLCTDKGQSSGGLYPPKDWNLLSEAVKLWAENTTVLPDVINIFNEPDARWRGSADDFVKIHNVISSALKEARPEAKVGGPGFYRIRPDHFRRNVEKGILKNMDYIVLHAYVHATPPEAEFIGNIIEIQNYLSATPYADLPIAFTEFGWTSPPGDWQKPVDELTKARYCARSMILCTVRNIRHLIYFAARFYQSPEEWNYSIVKPDYTPLPAMSAYSTLIRELAPVHTGGTWIKFAPGIHGAFFLRNGKSAGAFWTEKEQIGILLPGKPNYVRSMTGTLLNGNEKMIISPSPVYAEFSGTGLAKIQETPVQTILPEEKFSLHADEILQPPYLKKDQQGNFFIPESAPLGFYTVMSRNGEEWTAHRYKAISPLTVQYSNLLWSGNKSEFPELQFQAASHLKEKTEALFSLKFRNGSVLTQKCILIPEKTRKVSFKLPEIANGKRYTGILTVSCKKPFSWLSSCEFDATPLAADRYTVEPGEQIWKRIEKIKINPWSISEKSQEKISSTPAFFQMYASPFGFHLRVTANDPDLQRNAIWSEMWKSDSLQFAFDLDADREWQPNNVGNGLNGHRVVSFGLAYRADKTIPMHWCFAGYVEGVRSGPAFELSKTCKVARNEQKKQTVYTAAIPWKLIGANKMPSIGKKIGFALLLNDENGKEGRKTIPFFHGIMKPDAAKYGKFILRDSKKRRDS